jgi:hypothetical protein
MTSILTLQILARTITYDVQFLRFQPINRLFGASMALTTIVQLFFIGVVAFRSGSQEAIAQQPLPDRPVIRLNLEKKALQHFGLRIGGLIAFGIAYILILWSGNDRLSATILLGVSWLVIRAVEVAVSLFFDRRKARAVTATAPGGGA